MGCGQGRYADDEKQKYETERAKAVRDRILTIPDGSLTDIVDRIKTQLKSVEEGAIGKKSLFYSLKELHDHLVKLGILV